MHFGKCIKEVIRAWNGEPRGRSDPLRNYNSSSTKMSKSDVSTLDLK